MIDLIEVKKPKGGSLAYQSETEKGLLLEMKTLVNNLKPTKVHSVTRHDTEHEFGLVAVVEVPDVVLPQQPPSAKSPRRIK